MFGPRASFSSILLWWSFGNLANSLRSCLTSVQAYLLGQYLGDGRWFCPLVVFVLKVIGQSRWKTFKPRKAWRNAHFCQLCQINWQSNVCRPNVKPSDHEIMSTNNVGYKRTSDNNINFFICKRHAQGMIEFVQGRCRGNAKNRDQKDKWLVQPWITRVA